MPTPIYPSWNDKEYDLLKKMTENTALIADYEIGDVASVAGTAGNVLVNGGTAAATGAITLSLPSAIRVADGTLSAPVFSFSADSDTGLFRAASGSVAYASNGIRTFAFPTVTGSSGQFLTTDGAGNITWGTGSGTLPSQTGNAGKLLTTDGVNASWSSTLAGNLTVSGGTATLGSDASLVRQGNGWVQIANTSGSFAFGGYSVTTNRTDNYVGLRAINNTGGTSFGEFGVGSTATGDGLQNYGYIFTGAGLNGIRLFTNGSTTAKLTIDNAGLTTLAGNLTVSGGQIALAASASTPSVLITQTDPAQYSVVRLQNTGGTAQSYDFAVGGAGAGSLARKFYIYDNTASATRLAIAPTTGNLLIGTTIDGGQKLQVAGTVSFTGDLYSASAGSTWGADSGATGFLVYGAGGGANANKLVFRTNSTTALTLDSSQRMLTTGNAAFGGTSFVGASWGNGTSAFGTDAANKVVVGYLASATNGATIGGHNSTVTGWQPLNVAGSVLYLRSGGEVLALTLDSSQNATFAGRVATGGAASIGVAVSTGLGLNVNLDPGTLTYGAANAWLGARIRPARAGTTGNAFAISGQLEVVSGTQTKGATIMAEAPSGTITNHTYFYANSTGSRVAPNGNYSLYAESTAGPAYIGDATDSSSTTTGALTVAGGVGIAKKLYVGDNIISTGSNAALFFNSRTGANSNYAWYSPDGTVARLYDNTNAKTLVDFAANTGDATFAGSIRSNQATNISLTSGVATTIFDLTSSAGVFIVTATLDVNSIAGYAIVGKNTTGNWQVLANSGTQMSFSMSTNNLQITQTSGSTSTANTFNLLRLR